MKYQKMNILVIIVLLLSVVQCKHPSNDGLFMQCDDAGRIIQLQEKYSSMKWIPSEVSIYDIGNQVGIFSLLKVEQKSDDTYRMTLTITNNGNDTSFVEPCFPMMKEWYITGVTPSEIYHLFPRQGEMASNVDSIDYEEVYSGNFPFQFIDVYKQNTGGITVQLLDSTNYPKKFYFSKQGSQVNFKVIHRGKKLLPGQCWSLPSVEFTAHKGDWHAAFYKYRAWLQENLKPVTDRKEWFRDVYNFRQTFLHDNGGEKGAYNVQTKGLNLIGKVDESIKAFGGIDYLHLFDWGQTPEHGRCGDYNPWNYINKKELQHQISQIRTNGVPVGLYHEGYLLSPNSKVCKMYGDKWQMLNAKSKRYDRFGDSYYYPCPLVTEWREYIANTVSCSSNELGADGVYIDQFGFGWQYGCFNPEHDHDVLHTSIDSELQISAEAGLMHHIKKKLPQHIVTYMEECPTDISTQYQDGSFSYAVSVGRDSLRHNPSVVNLARFAFPDYKLIEILHIDSPMGNDLEGIKHVFFNAEGLWLSGTLGNTDWFPESVRNTIKKCYTILRTYKDAFRSPDPEPLVKTENPFIYANYFPIQNKRVWTFYNASDQSYYGNVIEVEAIHGARYYDAWNQKYVEPIRKGDATIIQLSLQGKDVGCLVQLLP